MTRRTLLDFFADVTERRPRRRRRFSPTTTELPHLDLDVRRVGRGRGGVRRAPAWRGRARRLGGRNLERKPPGMDRRAVGRAPRRRGGRPDRLPDVSRLPVKVAGIVDAKAILVGDTVDVEPLGVERRIWKLGKYSGPPQAFRNRPPTSDLRPPSSDLRPPSSDLRPPSLGLRHQRQTPLRRSSSRRARRPSPKGVVITHQNILANIVPIEREMAKLPKLRAAVPSDPLPEPAAAQPHVRPGDGDVRAADAAGRRRLHAQLRTRRHRPADQERRISVLVSRAEDPRGAAAITSLRVAPEAAGAAAGRHALV